MAIVIWKVNLHGKYRQYMGWQVHSFDEKESKLHNSFWVDRKQNGKEVSFQM